MRFDIYDGDEERRFVLGKSGANPLLVFGINPSTADQFRADATIRRVEKLGRAWDFDGFLMFNLYPCRNSRPENLPRAVDKELSNGNGNRILEYLASLKARVIWAAWGDAIDKRDYLRDCLEEILQLTGKLKLDWRICETLTKAGNPRHPLAGRPHIITNRSPLTEFDVREYLLHKPRA